MQVKPQLHKVIGPAAEEFDVTQLLESEGDEDDRAVVASKKESRNRARGVTIDARLANTTLELKGYTPLQTS